MVQIDPPTVVFVFMVAVATVVGQVTLSTNQVPSSTTQLARTSEVTSSTGEVASTTSQVPSGTGEIASNTVEIISANWTELYPAMRIECVVAFKFYVTDCLQKKLPNLENYFNESSTTSLTDDELSRLCSQQWDLSNCTEGIPDKYAPDEECSSESSPDVIQAIIDEMSMRRKAVCSVWRCPTSAANIVSTCLSRGSDAETMANLTLQTVIGGEATPRQMQSICRNREDILNCLLVEHSHCPIVEAYGFHFATFNKESKFFCKNIDSYTAWYECYKGRPDSVKACEASYNRTFQTIESAVDVSSQDISNAICSIKETELTCRRLAWADNSAITPNTTCDTNALKLWVDLECRSLPTECLQNQQRLKELCNLTGPETTNYNLDDYETDGTAMNMPSLVICLTVLLLPLIWASA